MYHRQHFAPAPMPENTEATDSFYLYYRTEPVVLLYRIGRRIHADEHNHAGRLMRMLDSLGKEGVTIRAVMRGDQTLDRSSLRALNMFLRYGHGLDLFRGGNPRGVIFHQYGWYRLQDQIGLQWGIWR